MTMKLKILLLITFVSGMFLLGQTNNSFETGVEAKPFIKRSEKSRIQKMILVSPSLLLPAYRIIIDSIKYDFTVSKEGKIHTIETEDKNKEVSGYRIGYNLPVDSICNHICYMNGWGYYFRIDEEWFAFTGIEINEYKILSFFKGQKNYYNCSPIKSDSILNSNSSFPVLRDLQFENHTDTNTFEIEKAK